MCPSVRVSYRSVGRSALATHVSPADTAAAAAAAATTARALCSTLAQRYVPQSTDARTTPPDFTHRPHRTAPHRAHSPSRSPLSIDPVRLDVRPGCVAVAWRTSRPAYGISRRARLCCRPVYPSAECPAVGVASGFCVTASDNAPPSPPALSVITGVQLDATLAVRCTCV